MSQFKKKVIIRIYRLHRRYKQIFQEVKATLRENNTV